MMWKKKPAGPCPSAPSAILEAAGPGLPQGLAREAIGLASPSVVSGRIDANATDGAAAPEDLLLRAITASDAEARAAFAAWRGRIDLDAPLGDETMALLPLLYASLQKRAMEDPFMARLKGVSRRVWYENSRLLERAGGTVAALSGAGIPCLLTGDLPLVLHCHENLSARRIGQADILLRPEGAERAASLLVERGLVVGVPPRPEEIAYHHEKRFDAPTGMAIVLHWHVLAAAANAATDDFFWHSSEAGELEGVAVRRVSTQALLLQRLLGAEGLRERMPRLWIADVLALADGAGPAPDWAPLADFAIRQKLAGRLTWRLRALTEAGLPIPDAVIRSLEQAKPSLPEYVDSLALGGRANRRRPAVLRRSAVLADYLRSARRPGLLARPADFSHFVRHRWGLKGRRQLLSILLAKLRRQPRPLQV